MDESVDVAPSADNGNIPLDALSEPTEPVAPAEPTEPVATTEPELYELPDGRKVDAETLSREWKDNFYPEYTRKSQELAAVKAPITKPEESPYAKPDYVPKSYEELLQVAEDRALAKLDQREQAATQARQEVEQGVMRQLEELKKADPKLDENALFLHANKYQFSDLKLAHENMKAMSAIAKTVQQTTVKNIAKRNDPVSVTPGAIGARPNASNFATARDFLRSLK